MALHEEECRLGDEPETNPLTRCIHGYTGEDGTQATEKIATWVKQASPRELVAMLLLVAAGNSIRPYPGEKERVPLGDEILANFTDAGKMEVFEKQVFVRNWRPNADPDTTAPDVRSRPRPVSPGRGAVAASAGDPVAAQISVDIVQEIGLMDMPFEVGKSYLICTVTLYYIGRVVKCGFGLGGAWNRPPWVHWTGRLSALMRLQSFARAPELNSRKPRVEPCGLVIVFTSAMVSAYPWTGKLPEEPVQ